MPVPCHQSLSSGFCLYFNKFGTDILNCLPGWHWLKRHETLCSPDFRTRTLTSQIKYPVTISLSIQAPSTLSSTEYQPTEAIPINSPTSSSSPPTEARFLSMATAPYPLKKPTATSCGDSSWLTSNYFSWGQTSIATVSSSTSLTSSPRLHQPLSRENG